MDFNDVSLEGNCAAIIKSARASAKQARKRKGEMVHDHPSTDKLVSDFLTNLGKTTASSMESAVTVFLVPAPYAPCVLAVNDLRPIMISDMRLETHHRGTGMLLHVLTPPHRMGAVTAIVEDQQGTSLLLQLYYQPAESVVPAREILQPGSVCIVKEPFFKCAIDGAYSLRVDHVTDVRVPAGFPDDDSNIIRARGNEAAKRKDWAEAERLYSYSIRAANTPEEEKPAYLNRSLANLRLGRPEKALSDATQCADAPTLSERGLFREAAALYKLGNFSRCMERLQILLLSNPTNSDAKVELSRARDRLHEQKTGKYNFDEMYEQSDKTPPLIDCATFYGPCEMRHSPEKGQGLFTTRRVSAGELLICEKAFAYSFAEESTTEEFSVLMNLSTKKTVVGGQDNLITQIVQKLAHDPKASREFGKLHCGGYAKAPVSEAGGLPVVDSFMVERIISMNGFGAPRTSQASSFIPSPASAPQDPRIGGGDSHTTCGVWVLASRINHSCLSNCCRSFIGDMQIIRTTTDLEAGTELLFTYRHPGFMESYEEVQKGLMNWEFSCRCDLCEHKKGITRAQLAEWSAVYDRLMEVINGGPRATRALRAQPLLDKLASMQLAPAGSGGRFDLAALYFALASQLMTDENPAEGVKRLVKGLEALRYRIISSPPGVGRPRLEVTRWGQTFHYTGVWAFVGMYVAYQTLAPELRGIAKDNVQTAYSMIVGERESICNLLDPKSCMMM